MASKKEKIAILSTNLQNNLNNFEVREDERVLLNSSSDFRPYVTNGIFQFNDKIGVQYLGYWVKGINGKDWALKIAKEPTIKKLSDDTSIEVMPDYFYIQKLNERMARNCSLRTIDSQVMKYSNNSNLYCIMSEDYRKPGYSTIGGKEIVIDEYLEYLDTTDFFEKNYGVKSYRDLENGVFNVNSLPNIYQALRYRYEKIASVPDSFYAPKKTSSIVDTIYYDLVLRYVFAYITMQLDFHLDNWEILEDDSSVYLSNMYDMEKSMKSDAFYNIDTNTSMKFSTNGSLSIDDDFQAFIDESEENKKIVERMLYLLTPQDILNFMKPKNKNDIVFPPGLQKRILEDYSRHFIKIEKMLSHKKTFNK